MSVAYYTYMYILRLCFGRSLHPFIYRFVKLTVKNAAMIVKRMWILQTSMHVWNWCKCKLAMISIFCCKQNHLHWLCVRTFSANAIRINYKQTNSIVNSDKQSIPSKVIQPIDHLTLLAPSAPEFSPLITDSFTFFPLHTNKFYTWWKTTTGSVDVTNDETVTTII